MDYIFGTIFLIGFIFGISLMKRPKTASLGNFISMLTMMSVIIYTVISLPQNYINYAAAGVITLAITFGVYISRKAEMTQMPELVALFNAFGGASSALVSFYSIYWADFMTGHSLLVAYLGLLIGCVSFSGSVLACFKLRGSFGDIRYSYIYTLILLTIFFILCFYSIFGPLESDTSNLICLAAVLAALLVGFFAVAGIGGADMPVVISLMNSYTGLAAAITGFVLNNQILIIVGALVGVSGMILTKIMCEAMNRSLSNVLLGGISGSSEEESGEYETVQSCDAEEAELLIEDANKVVIVPGYGMAVAQAQNSIKELYEKLSARGIEVFFAIHPVAGRMPGHMNVLLAEVDIPHDRQLDLEDANRELKDCDIALVIGANDTVNPAAINQANSPLAGMPIINAHEARTCIVIKRSLSPGYAKVKNPLFESSKSFMLFGDGKKMVNEINRELS